jgi:hypothetical protein
VIHIRDNSFFSDTMKPRSITITVTEQSELVAIEAARRAAYAALLHPPPAPQPGPAKTDT